MTLTSATTLIRNSHAANRLAHAYLVCGHPRGVGRRFAEHVGALLLGDAHPLDKHPDMLWIEPEKKSRIISIETVRETMLPWIGKTSYAGGWKVMGIVFADRFNDNSANAFLKNLEEPPRDTLFLLLTDHPESMLPTIISRTHRIDLSIGREAPAEPWRTLVGNIMAQHRPTSELGAFATAARLESIFGSMEEEAEATIRKEKTESDLDEDSDTLSARINAKYLELRVSAIVALQEWYRDLLVLSSKQTAAPTLFFAEHRGELERRAEKTTPRRALECITIAEDIIRQLDVRHISAAQVLAYACGRLA